MFWHGNCSIYMSKSNLVFHNLQYISKSYDLEYMVISDLEYMVTDMTTQHIRYVLFVSVDK